jgi:biotin operon repressor
VPYQRSQEIEQRLDSLLGLIRSGRYSTPTLAKSLGISQPTVSRCLTALRERGFSIRSIRDGNGWSYEVVNEPASAHQNGRGPVR